ncbi:MAG: DMT family transporter [Dehalococcoidia bacterium]|uniref:DMT family transporter n=1 Tax=Candidatus Amarobacter glycogenicus TaxID=3140699 RepID=UPI0031359483|nr:DMT family transporter [Dehalococcoidia bacterium]MCC6267505.1 DMT family transporter [Dehalococcoidia bacterium]
MTGRAFALPREAFASLTPHQQGLVAVLGAAILWSSGGLFIKWVSLDALGVTMWRSLLAGVVMWAIARPPMRPPWKTGKLTWGIAISYALTLVMFVAATKLTTAASAIFLQYTAPLYLLVTGAVFLHERATKTDFATVAVAFGGMALFFVGKLDADAMTGNALAAASGVTLAAMFTLLRAPGCAVETRPEAMVWGNILLVVGLFAVNLGRRTSAPFTPDLSDLAGLVFLGVVQIGFAYLLFGYGVAHVQALEASLIGMLEPVLNPVWVFLFLGETPGWWAVLGGAIIIAAVAARTFTTERGKANANTTVIPADI